MKKIIKKILSWFLVFIVLVTSFFVPKNNIHASTFSFQEVKEIIQQAYQQGQAMGYDVPSSLVTGVSVVGLALAAYGAEKLEINSMQDLIPRLLYGSNYSSYSSSLDDFINQVVNDGITNFEQINNPNIDVSNNKLELFIPDSVINETKTTLMENIWLNPSPSAFFQDFYKKNFTLQYNFNSSQFPTALDIRTAFIYFANKPVYNDIRQFTEADYTLYSQNISSVFAAANLDLKVDFISSYIKSHLPQMCDSRPGLTDYMAHYQVVTYSPTLNNFSIHKLCNTLNPIDLYQFNGRIYGFCEREDVIFSHSFPLRLKNGLFYDESSNTYSFIIFDGFKNIQLHNTVATKNYPSIIQGNVLVVDNFSGNDMTSNIWASHYNMPKKEERKIIVTKTNFDSIANLKRKVVGNDQGYVIDVSNISKSISTDSENQNISAIDISSLVNEENEDNATIPDNPANPETKDYTAELERLRQGLDVSNSKLGDINDRLSGINENVNSLTNSYAQALEKDISEQNKREEEYKKKRIEVFGSYRFYF